MTPLIRHLKSGLKIYLEPPEKGKILICSPHFDEILYRSGHLKKAAPHYQKALEHIKPDDANSAQKIAWILLQLGNCMREGDPSKAIEMYKKLIVEYPDSSWVDLAKAYCKLTQWYQEDEPETLLKK